MFVVGTATLVASKGGSTTGFTVTGAEGTGGGGVADGSCSAHCNSVARRDKLETLSFLGPSPSMMRGQIRVEGGSVSTPLGSSGSGKCEGGRGGGGAGTSIISLLIVSERTWWSAVPSTTSTSQPPGISQLLDFVMTSISGSQAASRLLLNPVCIYFMYYFKEDYNIIYQ